MSRCRNYRLLLTLFLTAGLLNSPWCSADVPNASEGNGKVAAKSTAPPYFTEEEFEIEGLPKQKYHFEVDYEMGELQRVNLAGTIGYVIRPTGKIDPERRWVWVTPLWLALPSGYGNYNARFYVEGLLEAGFHVAGFDVGASLGSPKGAVLYGQFHDHIVEEFDLAPKARMIAVSNGGLITYGYAFRNPERIDRIFAIYPAMDFRSWPKFHLVVGPAAITPKGVAYELTAGELRARIEEFNPIDNLAPLARVSVPLFHIHGDADELVPMDPNSTVTVERYREMGGEIELKVIPGGGHGGERFFTDRDALEFVIAPSAKAKNAD